MGVRERRQREREELRRAILDTARGIAAAEGWAAVTIRRVADKIEYSSPVIYEHFGSKEELVISLFRQGFRELLEEMRASRNAHSDPVEAFFAIARAYWSFSVAHPEMHLGIHGETAFEACASRSAHTRAADGSAVVHRPFDEVHDREESLRFFGSRTAKIPEDEPFPETREIFVTVRDALEQALGDRAGDLESLSWKVVTLWGAVHGLVTLAMAGMIPNGRKTGAELVVKIGRDLLTAWRAEETPWRPDAARESTRVKSPAR